MCRFCDVSSASNALILQAGKAWGGGGSTAALQRSPGRSLRWHAPCGFIKPVLRAPPVLFYRGCSSLGFIQLSVYSNGATAVAAPAVGPAGVESGKGLSRSLNQLYEAMGGLRSL